MNCDMKGTDGKPCQMAATHHWGPVQCCCEHFSRLVEGMFDLSEGVKLERHRYLVKFYEERAKILSLNSENILPEAQCAAGDDPGKGK